MTIAEILAKYKASLVEGVEAFDVDAALNTFVAEKLEGVNNKNQELLGKLKTNKEIVDALPEGFTAEKWAEMVKSLDGVDLSKLKTDEQVEAVKKNLLDSHGVEIIKRDTREQTLLSALQKNLVDSKVTAAIAAAHGNTTLLAPHISQRIKMVEEEGVFRAIVVDDKGTERFSLVKAGEHMAIDELVAEFKVNETYATAFNAGNGGGGGGGGHGSTQINPWKKGTPDYSVTEQGKLMNAQPELATQLQAAAKVDSAAA